MAREGWYRIWLIATIAITGFALLTGMKNNDIVRSEEGTSSCFPFTAFQYDDIIRTVSRRPTATELSAEMKRRAQRGLKIDGIAGILVEEDMTEYKEREVTYTNCASYSSVIRYILLGLLASLSPFIIALLSTWVWRGFKKGA